eukprot:1128879-Prymnesium_polylepis.1
MGAAAVHVVVVVDQRVRARARDARGALGARVHVHAPLRPLLRPPAPARRLPDLRRVRPLQVRAAAHARPRPGCTG